MQLNFAQIKFKQKDYKIYRIKYLNKEQLQELRNEHNKTNSFFRDGNYIYHSPMVKSDFFSEGELVDIDVKKDIDITKKLVHHIIFRNFFDLSKAAFTSFDTIQFFLKDRKNDFLDNILDHNIKKKLGYWRGFKLDTRVLNNGLEQTFGVIINVFYEWKIKISCKELVNLNFDIINRFVVTRRNTGVFIMSKLMGKIVNFDEQYVYTEKRGETYKIPIEEAFLENSYNNREDILNIFLGKEKTKEIFNYLFNNSQERTGAVKIKKLIDNILEKRLHSFELTNYHGFSFIIGDLLHSGAAKWNPLQLYKPTYIFNFQGNHTNQYADEGLKTYGPYSAETFADDPPLMIIICREKNKGEVTQFVGNFLEGMKILSNKPNQRQPFEQGFRNKYRLPNIKFITYTTNDESIQEYDKVLRRAIEENEKIDIAFVESCEQYKHLPIKDNPYYYTKSFLLQNGIPSQDVLYETMTLSRNQLPYILNNIGLAFYAKLGGKPWVILSCSSFHAPTFK